VSSAERRGETRRRAGVILCRGKDRRNVPFSPIMRDHPGKGCAWFARPGEERSDEP